MKFLRSATLLLALGALLVAGPAAAQLSAEDWNEIQTLRADMKADRQAVVAENLGLTEAEAPAFWPVYREYRNELDKVGDRTVKLLTDYALKYETLSDSDADTFFDEWMAIERERAKIRDKYVKKVREVLPAKKAARYFQIENKLDAVVNIGLAMEIPLAK